MSKLAALSYTEDAYKNCSSLIGLLQHSQLADDSNWAGVDIECLHMVLNSIEEKLEELKFEIEQECNEKIEWPLKKSTEIVDHGIIATDIEIGGQKYSIRKIEYK